MNIPQVGNSVALGVPKTELTPALPETRREGVRFIDLIQSAVNQTSQLHETANLNAEAFLLEKPISNVEVMTSIKKAELSLKLLMQVRNKLVDAYREIRQMQM